MKQKEVDNQNNVDHLMQTVQNYKSINEELKAQLDRSPEEKQSPLTNKSIDILTASRLNTLNSPSSFDIPQRNLLNQSVDFSGSEGSRQSTQRSREETKMLYKKLMKMGGMTASLMSARRDYQTLSNIGHLIEGDEVNRVRREMEQTSFTATAPVTPMN